MTDNDNKNKDPLMVDKNLNEMEEQNVEGGFFVANPHDARSNNLDSLSYEDHHQEFGSISKKDTKKNKE